MVGVDKSVVCEFANNTNDLVAGSAKVSDSCVENCTLPATNITIVKLNSKSVKNQ